MCNYREVYKEEEKNILLPWQNEIITYDTIRNVLIPEMISGEKYRTIPGRIWRTFIKRSFLLNQNIWFDEKITIVEDMLFMILLYSRVEKIFICGEVLYDYKINYTSAIRSYRKNDLERNVYSHKALVGLLKEEGLYENCRERCSRPFMRMYTYALSNAIRNPNRKEIRNEIMQIREYFLQEDCNWRRCGFETQIRIAYWMLEKNMITPLMLIYKTKEHINSKNQINSKEIKCKE